jgi:hypothetical protein
MACQVIRFDEKKDEVRRERRARLVTRREMESLLTDRLAVLLAEIDARHTARMWRRAQKTMSCARPHPSRHP